MDRGGESVSDIIFTPLPACSTGLVASVQAKVVTLFEDLRV